MKIKLNYIGKHQSKGEYEVEEKTAVELLKTNNWEKSSGEVEVDIIENPFSKYGKSEAELRNMSLLELRVFGKKNNLKSVDSSANDLAEEFIAEIKA